MLTVRENARDICVDKTFHLPHLAKQARAIFQPGETHFQSAIPTRKAVAFWSFAALLVNISLASERAGWSLRSPAKFRAPGSRFRGFPLPKSPLPPACPNPPRVRSRPRVSSSAFCPRWAAAARLRGNASSKATAKTSNKLARRQLAVPAAVPGLVPQVAPLRAYLGRLCKVGV